jgi:hypothetical protein
MKVGDSTSHGYTLGTFGAYPATQATRSTVIGACSGRQH